MIVCIDHNLCYDVEQRLDEKANYSSLLIFQREVLLRKAGSLACQSSLLRCAIFSGSPICTFTQANCFRLLEALICLVLLVLLFASMTDEFFFFCLLSSSMTDAFAPVLPPLPLINALYPLGSYSRVLPLPPKAS